MTTANKSKSALLDNYKLFLQLSAHEKFEKICNILDFYIAGEFQNKRLLFFLLLGNYHPDLRTLVLYRGDPSSGKSHVVKSVLRLFHKDDVYTIDSATEKALNYDEAIRGKKILFLREMREQMGIIEAIKAVYDEDRIHKETIQDEKEKRHKTITHLFDKLGVVTTLSFETVPKDLEDRAWIFIPDEKHSQTRNIVKFSLNCEKHLIDRDIKESSIHQQCYFIGMCIRTLDFDYKVYIPYVDIIYDLFPCQNLNERRDVGKLIHLIKIITLWNQMNRKSIEIGTIKYLFSEYTDLEMALEICQDLFVNMILHLDETKRMILDGMVEAELVSKKIGGQTSLTGTVSEKTAIIEEEKWYTITEIFETLRTDLGISRKTLQRKMDQLFYEGYLLREKPKKSYLYCKRRDYDIIKALKLEERKDQIDDSIHIALDFYKDKKVEMLEDNWDIAQELKQAEEEDPNDE